MSSTTTLANKTTISSRSKMAQLNNGIGRITTSRNGDNNMPPPPAPSLIARNPSIKPQTTNNTTAPTTPYASRLANLANGIPTTLKHNGNNNAINTKPSTEQSCNNNNITNNNNNNNNNFNNNNNIPRSQFAAGIASTPKVLTSTSRAIKTTTRTSTIQTSIKPSYPKTTAKLPLQTITKIERKPLTSSTTIKRPSAASSAASLRDAKQTNQIPDTNQIRRGLAKFSNPMECQRQFQALSSKIQQLEETVEARDNTVSGLQDQLKHAIKAGVGYATVVQYMALKLKLDSQIDLEKECEQLKTRVDELAAKELEYESKIQTIINDYKNKLQVEIDLRNNIIKELDDTKQAHSEFIQTLKETHKNELDDLNEQHSNIEKELKNRIEKLELDLETNIKELSDLRKEHELLTNDFDKLEKSLTKDKDARVKYLQEKINQLQKDVDSLNSVLEMRTEKIHVLEKDSLLLTDAQNDLKTHKDTIKALNQQLESVNAALDKKKEEFETLIAEHEKLRQELLKERTERRRMTMKSEQLEYVLNESCASESNLVYIRDVDNEV